MADKKISALTAATTPLAGTEVLPIVQSSATVKVSVNNLTAGKTVPANAVIVGPGSLSAWGSNNSPVEVGIYGTALAEQSSGSGLLVWNIYQDSGGNFKYKTSNPGLFHQLGNDGVYRWYSAASGSAGGSVSLTLRQTIDGTSGDITNSTGNFVQGTAAKGVNFTANTPAAGMTSQLLNWYEEGTWTGGVSFGGAATGITYNNTLGYYTRIGNLVTVTAYIYLLNKGSSTGAARITGLPFTCANNGAAYSAPSLFFSNLTYLGQVSGYININDTTVDLYQTTEAGTASAITDTNFANNTAFILSLTYRAA